MSSLLNQDSNKGSVLICTARHRESLANCLESVSRAIALVQDAQPAELVAFDIRQGLGAISEIVGVSPTEDILGRIFSKFCIGK
jgi:tRNA modification GTPase